ncbi:MAG: MBL fold metallo-hydrolase [Eubacteriales bacterium]|nr:MBL fold metallo-hydrolase [Eubacteriales bacterium]
MIVYSHDTLRIFRLPDGPLQTNSYWIDTGTTSCLIDPILDPRNRPVQVSKLSLILATHGHYDHIGHADDWRAIHPVKLGIHRAENKALTDASVNLSNLTGDALEQYPAEIELHDNQKIALDANVTLQVIHTPGHSSGGVCYLVFFKGTPQALLTGDTLFAGTVGRVDLRDGDAPTLMKSLQKLVKLSSVIGEDTIVLPGHGPATTLRDEKKSNPYL